MTLESNHNYGDIDGTRVTFLGKKIERSRMEFLKELMEYNGFEVIVKEEKKRKEEDPDLFTLGVTDMLFNPTIWVFGRKLKTLDGHIVTREYWEQISKSSNPHYWNG